MRIRSLALVAAGVVLGLGATAMAAGPGAISSLFEDVSGAYKLLGSAIKDGTVGTAQIADASLTSAKLADASVTSAKIADGTVGAADLADASVTDAKIASVDAAKVSGKVASAASADSAAVATAVVAGSVMGASLADASVTSAKIADGAVATADLADASVTAAKIVSLPYSKLTDLPAASAETDPNVNKAIFAGPSSCSCQSGMNSCTTGVPAGAVYTSSTVRLGCSGTTTCSPRDFRCSPRDYSCSCTAALTRIGYIKP